MLSVSNFTVCTSNYITVIVLLYNDDNNCVVNFSSLGGSLIRVYNLTSSYVMGHLCLFDCSIRVTWLQISDCSIRVSGY